ncbi:MAG: RnfABCDGE type electron transport complex subunit D [Leptolyngbyaceae cyanobacterium CAN_BIN12]|nr:RnfABCDGE type electron transport complex subunit D [Leptolyngbyaceae cyanobacterium CAN_BIN12]
MQIAQPSMFRDARLYQILFLSLFLLLGTGTRDWTLHPEIVATAIATCLITQWIWSVCSTPPQFKTQNSKLKTQNILSLPSSTPLPLHSSLPSALITALGLSMLLRTEHIGTMILAAVIAISSKFLLKVNGKHLFNPTNLGIVAAVVLTHDAWISPGQWGESSWYALLFLGTGGVVVQRVGRWDTTGAFLGSYALLELGRNLWLGWTWDVLLHRLSSGSLLVFSLFMITDPRTIPNARVARLIWAGAIALLAFILRNVYFIPTAVFWSLFALAPLSAVLDFIWASPQFTWQVESLENADNSDAEEPKAPNNAEPEKKSYLLAPTP